MSRQGDPFSPPPWLTAWLDHIPHGRALDLGAGRGDLAAWLSRKGFLVSAVERDPERLVGLRELASKERFEVIEADLLNFHPAPTTFSLIVASAVLHFLHPEDLEVVAGRLKQALRSGGFLMAEVFTVDDPSFAARLSTEETVATRTFHPSDRSEPIHYFARGQLRAVFSELQILSYDESRRLDLTAEAGYRAGATLVSRRPNH